MDHMEDVFMLCQPYADTEMSFILVWRKEKTSFKAKEEL